MNAIYRGALLSALALGLAQSAGCGDDSGRGESDSSTSVGETAAGSESGTATATMSGSESASATDASAGSESNSASQATSDASAGPTTTTASATDGTESATDPGTDTDADTDTDTDTDTGGELQCEDEPAPGWMVMPNDQCESEPQVGEFNPIIEWHKDMWADVPGSRSSVTTPVVVQLTDDNLDGEVDELDIPDIVFITYDGTGVLRAVSGDGMNEIFSVTSPGLWRNQSLAAADIDNDGLVEIVTVGQDKVARAFEQDGSPKWASQALGANVGTYDNAPAISDMNGDGTPEIVVGRAILDNQGNLIGAGGHGIGSPTGNGNGSASMSFAVDLNDDGLQEVVVGNALYQMDGQTIWHNGLNDGYPAVADLHNDGEPEIIVVYNNRVRAQTANDGTLLWDTAIPGGIGGPPTVADFDGDGFAEVGVAGRNNYSVFEGDGSVLWTNQTQDQSSGITGSSVYDFEGDGIADVVYADETTLWVFSGNDGSVKLALTEHNSGTRLEYPVIVDVDNDDQVEIAFVSEPYNGTYRGLTVIGDADESWRPGRKIWNQHAYHITNVNDDGSVPQEADKNWLSYNNFRSGDLSANDGLAAPDIQLVVAEQCANECQQEDVATIWLHLGNAGAAPLTAGVTIEVYQTIAMVETLQTTVNYDEVIEAGVFTDAFSVEVNIADVEQLRLVALPGEEECVVDPDNEVLLTPPFCNVPG